MSALGSHRPADVVLIACLWALLFLPAAGLHTLHYEEGRRALAALDMLAHGHWAVPEVLGLPYVNKPPLLPWLIAAMGWLLGGVDEWAVRLPPLMITLAGALLVCTAARRHGGRVAGLTGAAAFLLTPMILEKAAVGETDTTVTVAVFAAFLVWWDGAHAGRVAPWRWLVAALLLALAALAKGPVPLAYFAAGVGLFALWRRRRGDLPGLAAALLLALVPVGLWALTAHEPGRADHWQGEMRLTAIVPSLWAYLDDRIDLIGELAALLMPWLALAVPVFVPAWRRRLGIDPKAALALGLYAGGFTALLLVWPTALPRYAMPAVPAVAVAAGLAAAALWDRRRVRRLIVAAAVTQGGAVQLCAPGRPGAGGRHRG
jgi:4-amino-4-deoxy-L-arabinose transferase-like glycosyltransferase